MTEAHYCLDDSPRFRMVELDEVTSTNDFLKHYRPAEERRLTLVTAEYQTAGRGWGTNRWESERGRNLVFSLLVHPRHIAPERIFLMSEVLALAIRASLEGFAPGEASSECKVQSAKLPSNSKLRTQNFELASPQAKPYNSELRTQNLELTIKWPNDIYYGDGKICGMLIENDLRGGVVESCIMGVGVNVNQTVFESDAPNPVSLAQVVGHEVERRFVLERIIERFQYYYGLTEQGRGDELHAAFLSRLYRKDEQHSFIDRNGPFEGTIVDVEPTGHLVVEDTAGQRRRYGFKEVQFVIEN